MTVSTTAARLGFRRQRPEPAGFWIGYRPARWPGPEEPWLDLARAALGASRPGASLEISPGQLEALDDLVYLAPVAPERRAQRDRLAAELRERGVPVLAQLRLGEPPPPEVEVAVFDPLPELLAGESASLAGLPAGAVVVWGLVAGLTDDADLCRRGLEALARAGVERVVPLAPDLAPREKRRLAGADERAFARLFHGGPPSERGFARLAAAAGLATRLDRPPPAAGTPRPGNRSLAARLVQIADYWLRLGRQEADAQELFRAARWIESADRDIAALEREGNLGVLGWLSDKARRQVEAALTHAMPPLLAELEAEYLGLDGGPRPRATQSGGADAGTP